RIDMRPGGRRITGVVAIYAIALHAILWGVAPMATGPSADTSSVICHSETPAEQSPASPAHSQSCDHCTLCSAAAAPAALNSAAVAQLAPARLLQVLRPASAAAYGRLATTPHLARGPPAFA